MAKRTASIADLVDELGEAEARIIELKARAGNLRGRIGRFGVGYHTGEKYRATVAAVIDARGGVHVTVKRRV